MYQQYSGVKVPDNAPWIALLDSPDKLHDALDGLALRELESIQHPISKERQKAIMLCPSPIALANLHGEEGGSEGLPSTFWTSDAWSMGFSPSIRRGAKGA